MLLKPHMDADTKILMFGSPYEAAWIKELGISPEQVEVYDPTACYYAEELLVPSPSMVITPAKETYQLVRQWVNCVVHGAW